MRWGFALGSLAAAACVIALLVLGIRQSASRQMTLDVLLAEAHERVEGRRIQLAGCTVVPGTIEWDEYRHRPRFRITDGERQLAVQYTGNAVLPDTFQDRAQVVMQGRFIPAQRRFEAEVVAAKCPSKYEGRSYDDHPEALRPSTGSI